MWTSELNPYIAKQTVAEMDSAPWPDINEPFLICDLPPNCTSYGAEKSNLLWQRKSKELISLDWQL